MGALKLRGRKEGKGRKEGHLGHQWGQNYGWKEYFF
jgi:hypothetical protein